MRRAFVAGIAVFAACSTLLCGFVPACGGIGYFVSDKKVREYVDGMAEAIQSPQNFTVGADKYEYVKNEETNSTETVMVYRSFCVFGETVTYYELDFKTGNGAFYNNGVLETFDKAGERTVTSERTAESVYAYFCVGEIIEAVRTELAKPVQEKRAGYYHFVNKSTFISYSNKTDGDIGGLKYFSFFTNFNVHKSQPLYRSYSFGFNGAGFVRRLAYNSSGMTAEDLKLTYENFKITGQW